MKKFGIKEVVATGIGTALFIVLTEVQIPLGIIPNTSMQPRAAVLAFLAAVFEPVVGGIIGLLGHALGDALFYGGVWWSWVFPDAIFGILVGLFAKRFEIKAGGFNKKKVVLFNVVQVVANAIAWIVVAPVLDILIYAEPAKESILTGRICVCSQYHHCGCTWFITRTGIYKDWSKIIKSYKGRLKTYGTDY